MSTQAWFDAKQRVKQAIDIVDLVQSYLPLRREGRGFKALCPWHDDTRPSLQVNSDRQSFKCWVCDIGGDIFSFVMKMEGVEFPEALKMLADRANITLEPAAGGGPRGAADDKRVLYQAMAWADAEYHRCLQESPEAETARSYLASRHITPEMVRRFQLGFAPLRWDWIVEQARGANFSPAVLERIGLVTRRKQGAGFYDRFRGRVLFPIFDSQGRAVGTGGRVLPGSDADAAKYVNSPETPLFSKSNLLYGLDLARDAIRKTGAALVMEGYTDCIIAHQFGFHNAVAVLGTALGASHVQLLRRYAERVRVVLVLDGDEAGRKRAKEVLELFVAANVDLRVLTLPGQMDPADYLLTHGAQSFTELMQSAPDALAHAFAVTTAGIDLRADVQGASTALKEIISTVGRAPRPGQSDDLLRDSVIIRRIARDFDVPEIQARKMMSELRRPDSQRKGPQAAPASVRQPIDALERELLELLSQFPELIEQVALSVQPAQFVSDAARGVFAACVDLWGAGIVPDFERLLLENDDPVVKNLLVELDERGREKSGAETSTRLRDVLSGFERRQQEQHLRGRTAALKQRHLREEDALAVLVELERHERARQAEIEQRAREGISEPTDG